MKHLRQTFLLCLLWMIGMATYAEEIPNNEIWYEASSKLSEHTELFNFGLRTNAFNVAVTSHTFSDGKGIIRFDGDVTSIGDGAFYSSNIRDISLPNSVKDIGWIAFAECSNLTSFIIPSSVTNISQDAFGSTSLTRIIVESDNNKYDSRDNCNAIIETATNTLIVGCKTTVIPNSVTCIGGDAFMYCRGLTSITIPNSVTSIEHQAFHGCSGLRSIAIPNSVTNMAKSIFAGCYLTSIVVESGNMKYDSRNNCNAIIETATNTLTVGCQNTIIPNSVTEIGENAFLGCSSLTSIEIPSSVISIGNYAFESCSSLTSFKIPNSVTSIGKWAFADCSGLTSIVIPNSVTSIGNSVFKGCSGLVGITVESGNTVYDSRDNCNAIVETSTNSLISGCKNTIIPNSVKCIEFRAFFDCSGLKGIEIPNSVENIEDAAFSGCYSLTSIDIPNSVTSIGVQAFYNCSSLSSISISNSVTSFGDYVFQYCTGLRDLCIFADTPCTIDADYFDGVELSAVTLHVPAGTKALYEQADIWKDFGTIVEQEIPCNEIWYTASEKLPETVNADGLVYRGLHTNAFNASITSHTFSNGKGVIKFDGDVTNVGKFAFYGCSNLTSITLSNSVTSIDGWAFSNCTDLAGFTIPNSVTNISGYVFMDCTNITDIIIPKSVTEIACNALSYATGLASVIVESGNTKYDSRDNCNAIIETATNTLVGGCKNTVIPNSVNNIGFYAFDHCSGLTNITMPNSVTSIGVQAFDGCSGLKSIEIPKFVKYIGDYAFRGCSSLTSIIVESGNTKYDSRNDCNAIIETATNTLISGCKNTVIPNSVTSIGDYAFSGSSGLTSITIPDFVTSIGNGAFSGCSSLTSIAIPNSVTSIEDDAFSGCSNLTSIDIPNTVKSIGSYAFANCSGFTSIAIPNSVTSIEDYAFYDCSNLTSINIPKYVTSIGEKVFEWCFHLTSVYVNWDEPLNLASNPFYNYRLPDCTLYVPAGTKALYEQANVWKDFGKIVECLEPTTDITSMANVLYIKDIEARQGTELTIPLNLKNAEENITAFECKVYLPAGVEWAYTTDKRGNKVLTLPTFNEDRTDANYHTINGIKQMDDGSYYIIVYSDSKEAILENDGAVLYLPVAVSNEIEAGEYNILVKDIVIVNKNTEQTLLEKTVSKLTIPSYTIGDANDDKMINITDVVAVISYMLQENPSPFVFKAADVNEDGIINVTDIVGIIDIMTSGTSAAKPRMARMKARKAAKTDNSLEIVPFTVAEGTTTKTVALELNNPGDEFTAFECKVYLPAGVEWAYTIDRRGNKIYTQPTFNEDRTDANYHTINSIKKMDDGGYYVIVYSDKKEIFLEEEGALLYLPLVFSEDMTPGVYDIRVGGIVLTRPDVTQELLDDYTASVMVGSPDIASLTLFGDFTADAIGEYNTALASNVKVAAMDFSNATDVDATTAIATGNRNLLVYVAEDMSIANTANVVVGDVCESLVLTDGYPFCAPRAFTATEASYTRTLNGNCATICLPFAPTAGNATFFCLSSVDGNVLNFTSTGAPLANTPYLIKADGGTATATAVNAEINTSTAGTATSAGWTLNGTFSEKSFTSDDDVYALSSGKLYHNTGTLTIAPFRAYFTFSGSGVKEMSVSLDGEATGITFESSAEAGTESRFNLNGQAVGRDYKGIVIINGRKEFRK